MTQRNYSTVQRSRKGPLFIISAIACAIVAVVACLSLNVGPAGAGSTSTHALGLTEVSELAEADSHEITQEASDINIDENSVLTVSSERNIDQAIDQMLAREEAERKAAEEARLAKEAAEKAQAEAAQAASAAAVAAAGISEVDWSVGHDEFVKEWTVRIDNYLAGSTLAGYGSTFAEAAWTYGVDPRLSPAISNTESTKGQNCFLPYNAWGWGQSSWGSWEQAINAHIKGLADGGYGPMVTYADAKRYCPPTYDSWYHNTISQIAII